MCAFYLARELYTPRRLGRNQDWRRRKNVTGIMLEEALERPLAPGLTAARDACGGVFANGFPPPQGLRLAVNAAIDCPK